MSSVTPTTPAAVKKAKAKTLLQRVQSVFAKLGIAKDVEEIAAVAKTPLEQDLETLLNKVLVMEEATPATGQYALIQPVVIALTERLIAAINTDLSVVPSPATAATTK